MILAIDIGGTKRVLALLAEDGALLAEERRPMVPSGSSDRDLETLVADARALLGKHVGAGRLSAVGVAVPGPMDAGRRRVQGSPNLPGWRDVALADALESALAVPVHIENDANAAALAEWRFGAGAGADPFVFLTMSTGVGGGVVANGALVRGPTGNAGEIGHLPLVWEGAACACGLRGCAEAYLGGAAWAARLRAEAPADSEVVRLAGARANATPEHVVAAARVGDAYARAELTRFNRRLAHLIVSLAFVLSPERIVLGTIAAAAGDALCLDPVRALVRTHAWPQLTERLEILPSALGPRLPALAGLCAALEAG